MDDARDFGPRLPSKKKQKAASEPPQWLIHEQEELQSRLDILNKQIASIPQDSSLRNLRTMMKETAKGLQKELDELEEFIPARTPRHRLLASKKD